VSDCEVLVRQLREMQNGANVHTVNKAVGYLRSLSGPAWYIEDDEKRKRMLAGHVKNCEQAVKNKSVTVLEIMMRRWF